MRARRALSVVAVTLGLVLTACGGDGDSSADPSPSESPESESPSPSPTETGEAGPPKQPKGKHGVTYRIQNWGKYAEEPVVLAWKKTWEALGGSVNQGEMVGGVVRRTRGEGRRMFVGSAQQAWDNDWHTTDVVRVRMQNVQQQGRNATVVACIWGPSASMYQQGGEAVDLVDHWVRQRTRWRQQGGEWRMMSVAQGKECKGMGDQ